MHPTPQGCGCMCSSLDACKIGFALGVLNQELLTLCLEDEVFRVLKSRLCFVVEECNQLVDKTHLKLLLLQLVGST